MTAATRDMLSVIWSKAKAASPRIQALEYVKPFAYEGETICLHDAGHILGSAQVVVRDREGVAAGYTGDFKLPEAGVLRVEVLVMEATYGAPGQVRTFTSNIEEELLLTVRRCLGQGPVYIFGYHGKLQEVANMLHRASLGVPLLLEARAFALAQVCEKYGLQTGDCREIEPDLVGQLPRAGEPYVALLHIGSRARVPERASKVTLSGWQFDHPVRQTGPRRYSVALSDHSDFQGLLDYVAEARPELVITDSYRVGDAAALAQEIQARLGIRAQPMP